MNPNQFEQSSDDEAPLLDDLVCFALHSASRATIAAYRPALQEFGLTYLQYLVMLLLWEKNARSLGEIGAKLFLDSGTLTPLMKRLVRSGFVSRRRDTFDERVVRFELTDMGRSVKPKVVRAVRDLACQLQNAPVDLDLLLDSVIGLREHWRSNFDVKQMNAQNEDGE